MILLEGINKSFEENQVLKDVNITIESGERISLTGPGGCGKTTLLKVLLGLIKPDSGRAELMGTPLNEVSSKERIEVLKKVGMAFQQGGLFDFMTVGDNLRFAMDNMTEKSKQDMQQTITDLLNSVKLGHTENMFPHELSGGMKRRVGIARALCTDPIVAIFDEPTAGLDPVTSTIILNMIKELGARNDEATLMVSTSNVEIAIRFADRVVVMGEDGDIAADGPWRELLVTGPDWVKHFLGTRFIGLDLDYAIELDLPKPFIDLHWHDVRT